MAKERYFCVFNKTNSMLRFIPLFVILLFTGKYSEAQTHYASEKSIIIQTDVFDFAAKGFSVWGGYTFHYNRIFIAGGKNELPDFLNPLQANFYEQRKYFVQGGYYRFLHKPEGLFLGVEAIFQQMEITAKATNEIQDNQVLRAAPVIGFAWVPFKTSVPRLTITPWMSERLPIVSPSVSFTTIPQQYQTADFNFVMGLNIGYQFGVSK